MAAILGPIGNLADHALRYAIAGLEVFPANPTTKAPLTPHGMQDATTNEAIVIDWWRQHPNASIAHRLPAGVVVCDIDFRHGGDATWRALVDAHGPMPATRVHYSGRGDGGGHVWFGYPEGKLSTRALDEWAAAHDVGEHHDNTHTAGVDLLHHGHRYTILPPSVHATSGNPYRWKGDGLAVAVAPIPTWLAELVVVVDEGGPGASNTRIGQAFGVDGAGPPVDSIADWYTANHTWSAILGAAGWYLRRGDGDSDGSEWRHPRATADKSATITHGCLFVYSPNTGFEVTEVGNPHGYTRFAAYAVLAHDGNQSTAAKVAHAERYGPGVPTTAVDPAWASPAYGVAVVAEGDDRGPGPWPIDWPEFWTGEHEEADWLCPSVWPRGRQVTMWATHKTGKSLLTLDIAAAYATGRPMLGQAAVPVGDVVYLDLEMTQADVFERLTDLGYSAADDLGRLHYYLLPWLPPLDSIEGGRELARLVDLHGAAAVVIDTLARVVEGDENEAKTYTAFYRNTGLLLKQRGVSLLRLDHGGKDPTKGPRGSSAKGDDVDVVWRLDSRDAGHLLLRRERSRVSWVPESVPLLRHEEPLRHVIEYGNTTYPDGTAAVAKMLAGLGLPLDVPVQRAMAALHDAGQGRRKQLVAAALRMRREIDTADEFERLLGLDCAVGTDQ